MNQKVLAFLATTLFVMPLLASAQDTRADRLERRLMQLEQQLYAMQGGLTGKTTPAAASGKGTVDNSVIADFEARLGQMEEEANRVYGAVEELGHAVDEFAKKMELISKDFDLRIQDLEDTQAELVAARLKAGKAPSAPVKKAAAKKKPVAKKVAQKVSSSDSVVPQTITPEDLYNKAYNFVVATAYPTAEVWMKEFLKRHESHELADNANYWLGEIYLVQDKPEDAVVSFSTGIAKFPKGAKAAGNLLKMGVAFKRLGKVDYAKGSWDKLMKDFPESLEAKKAAKELEKLKDDSGKKS